MQVPLARGSVMPEIASMSEDFPALCQPITAMEGMSRSTSALQHGLVSCGKKLGWRYGPKGTHSSQKLEHAFPSGRILWVGQANGCHGWVGSTVGVRVHTEKILVLVVRCHSSPVNL